MSHSSMASLMDVELQPGKPPMVRAETGADPASWAAGHRSALRTAVAEHGSVLIRGLGLRDAAATGAVFQRLAVSLMPEKEAFAPREPQAGGLYSATPWPPNQQMCMHHELSYRLEFPGLMLFACLRAADSGGATPHVTDVSWFGHNPVVLHVSLRDLAPEILLASTNVVDDVEHCLKANTSPHLAEQLTGNRDFLAGTLDDVMAGRVTVPTERPVVFSPFGLGVLDLAVGKYVYDEVTRSGELHVIDDFFYELRRYAPGPA